MSYLNSDMLRAIDETVHNALHREILKMRLLDGLTYEQIAERVERTPRQIYNIMAKHSAKLKDLAEKKK